MKNEPQQYKTVDKFDRLMGALAGLPDVAKVKPSPLVTLSPLIGETQTFIVETWRQKETGDFIFLQYIDADRSLRIVIPPEVASTIARQREALTTKVRKKVARDQAAARKARGEVPAFLKGKRRKPHTP